MLAARWMVANGAVRVPPAESLPTGDTYQVVSSNRLSSVSIRKRVVPPASKAALAARHSAVHARRIDRADDRRIDNFFLLSNSGTRVVRWDRILMAPESPPRFARNPPLPSWGK